MKYYTLIMTLMCVLSHAKEQPNILFIMTDDQGYAPVGAHGHPWIETPNMDQMYNDSVRFDRFMTGSTCAPSRAGIMSGTHSIRNGVTHTIYERERLNLAATTIPEVLNPAGYTSGYFGKWHLGDEDEYQPENRGFEEVFIHGAGGIGQKFPGSCADAPRNSYFNTVFKHNGTFVKTNGYCTDTLFDATLDWIYKVKDGKKPFFAYLSTNAPHGPFIAPESFQKKFEDLGFPKGAAGFYGMIEHIDECMGEMFVQLEEWGILDNTVIIFTSDNGMTIAGSGLWDRKGRPQEKLGTDANGKEMMTYNAEMRGLKSTVDEGGVRVPFFVQWKDKIKKGKTVDTLSCYLDIMPTLAEIGKADLLEGQMVEGRSLVPLIFEDAPEWEDRMIFQHVTRWGQGENPDRYKWHNYSVRNQRFRLVQGKLYDMENDPSQLQEVTKQFPEQVEKMKSAYSKFWDEVRPLMIHEDAKGPEEPPYHVDYFKQEKEKGIHLWEKSYQ